MASRTRISSPAFTVSPVLTSIRVTDPGMLATIGSPFIVITGDVGAIVWTAPVPSATVTLNDFPSTVTV